jgi:hypothetical protein
VRVEAGYTQLFPGRYRTERDAESLLLLLLVFGLLTLANAVWMLAGPMHWYTKLAAGVPDTGPFNPHFVRDIGDAFLTTGIALLWAYRSPHFRLPLVGVAATFLACHAMPCHALLHLYDTARGALGHDHCPASHFHWSRAPGEVDTRGELKWPESSGFRTTKPA